MRQVMPIRIPIPLPALIFPSYFFSCFIFSLNKLKSPSELSFKLEFCVSCYMFFFLCRLSIGQTLQDMGLVIKVEAICTRLVWLSLSSSSSLAISFFFDEGSAGEPNIRSISLPLLPLVLISYIYIGVCL